MVELDLIFLGGREEKQKAQERGASPAPTPPTLGRKELMSLGGLRVEG